MGSYNKLINRYAFSIFIHLIIMIKKILFTIALVAAVCLNTYAKGENEVTTTFAISPVMHCANCEAKIKTNLRYEKGVKEIQTNSPDSLVTVKYDKTKTNPDAIIKGFKKFGYTAKVAAPAAAKKECCGKCHQQGSEKSCCGKCHKQESAKACNGSCKDKSAKANCCEK